MADDQLYAIYASAYRDASHFAAEEEGARCALPGLRYGRLSAMERAVSDLGTHEASNGTPMRSRAQFDRCLREGALLLRRLHLRDLLSVQAAAASGGPSRVAWVGT